MDQPRAACKHPDDAAWAVRPLKKYAVFSGRSPRAEFWWFYLAWFVLDRILVAVDKRLFPELELLASLLALVTLIPWTALTIRRLHDIDRSGWWLGAFMVLVIVLLGLFATGTLDDSAGWTEASPELVALAVAVVAVLCFLIFMVTPGTPGPNRFGPDPYASEGDTKASSLAASGPA